MEIRNWRRKARFSGGGASSRGSITGVSGASVSPQNTIGTYAVEKLSEKEALAQGYTVIKTADQLANMGSSGKYILMADIDLSGRNWVAKTLGAGAEFNGNGYEIKNLKGSQGLFVTSSGTIKNVRLTMLEIHGNTGVGGLVGVNYGVVERCAASGQVKGYLNVGGLVGTSDSNAKIFDSFSDCTVFGNSAVGGLVGWQRNSVMANSYALGKVQGSGKVGGLIGASEYGKVEYTYSVGQVIGTGGGLSGFDRPNIDNGNFYDKDTSGKNTSTTGSALTTFEMLDMDTYINAGWDISEYDGQNPPTTTWFIKDGELPKLAWEWVPLPPPQPSLSVDLQIGANSGENNTLNVELGFSLNGFEGDVTTIDKASDTLNAVDELKKTLVEKRSDIGVLRNRLEGVINSQGTKIENLSASNSTMIDTDFASESAALVRSQILQNATSSLLKQANFSQQLVLQLLG